MNIERKIVMNSILLRKNIILLLFIGLIFSTDLFSQLEVNSGITAQEMADAIAGPGIQIQNPQITGAAVSYGSYSTENTLLPFASGIILSTGKASNAIGPNNVQHKSYINGTAGSLLLDSTMGQITNDACVFEFDLIPQGDTIRFNFTFASEEYHNFVGSSYSDVFGFYISGPGIVGLENIALIPGTSDPININNINSVINNEYFSDNDNPPGNDLQYNGYTINLEAIKAVNSCDSYHLTLVIADANDYSIDSGVFIEKIESSNASLTSATAGGIEYMIEGCNDGTVTFTRLSEETSEDITVTFYVDGTALNGIDYIPQIGVDPDPAVAKTIVIPSGSATSSITVSPVIDGIPNVNKYMAIYLASSTCPDILYDSLFFPIFDSLIVNTGADTAICFGESLNLQTLQGGSAWSWTPSDALDDPFISNPLATPDTTTTFILHSTASTCEGWDTTQVYVSNINVSIDSIKSSCFGLTDGFIEISITGGRNPHLLSWTGPNGFTDTNLIISNLEPGSYNYSVVDAIGCSSNGEVTVGANDSLSITLSTLTFPPFNHNIACFGDSSGIIYSNVTGGSPDYQYTWSPGGQISSFIDEQTAGNYALLVIDAEGCMALDTITLTEPAALEIQLDSLQNINCKGDNTGYLEVSASGGSPAYTFTWNTNPPSTGSTLSEITAGTYGVTIVDVNACSMDTTFSISEPTSTLDLSIDTIIDVECPGMSDGSISVTAVGGSPPYNYQWNTNPVQIGATATNLDPGNYIITVIDSLACEFSLEIEVGLSTPQLVAIVTTIDHVSCNGESNGSATVAANGGSWVYTYLWTPGNYTTSTVNGLAAGIYNVLVEEVGICNQSVNVSLTIDQPIDPLTTSLNTSSFNGYNLLCFQSGDGSITSTTLGGSPAYNYNWTGPSGFSSSAQNISGLNAGQYFLNIVDQNNCTTQDSITLTEPNEIEMTFVMLPATCPTPGSNDGSISTTVTGGVAPYTYDWSGPNGFSSNLEDITNLEAGIYYLIIEDDINCKVNFVITVTQPDGFIVSSTLSNYIGGWNVSCNGNNDGNIDVSVSNVTPPTVYSWVYDGFEVSTDTFVSNAFAGEYELIITDANNCIENRFFTLAQPDSLLIDFDAFIDGNGNSISCFGGSDGNLTATISGGTRAYNWLWTYPDNSTNTDTIITNISEGNYSLQITDANSCIEIDSIVIAEPDSIEILLISPDSLGYHVSCFDGSDGNIFTTIIGGTPPFNYQWTYPTGGIGSTDQNPSFLQSGTYILLLSDANNCSATDSITLLQADPIIFSSIVSDYNSYGVPCNGDSIASIQLIPSGGIPPYLIIWDSGDTNDTMTGLGAGTYQGQIIDSVQCWVPFTITISEPQAISVLFDISSYSPIYQLQCFGDSSGFINTTISGGTPPYNVSWTGPNGFVATTDSIDTLIAGDYSIIISDQNSCSVINTITLNEPEEIQLSISQINSSLCFGDSSNSLFAIASGGNGGFIYSWTGPNGFVSDQALIENLPEGTYCVNVTDQNSCLNSLCYDVIDSPAITITLSSPEFSGVNVLCNGDSTGSIISNVSGGVLPYNYFWTGPEGSSATSSNPTNLIAGYYTLIVTDSVGCTSIESIILSESDAFITTITTSNYNDFGVSCNGFNNGAIGIRTINGLPPYTYSWSNNSGIIGIGDTLSNLYAGSYFVTITDLNTCTANDTVILTSPDSLILALISPEVYPGINISCNGGVDGQVQSLAAGGVADYSYSWSGPNSFISSDSTIVQLIAGWYNLTATDQNGCIIQDSLELIEPDSALTVVVSVAIQGGGTNINCLGGNNGSISINISGGLPNYQVYWLGPNGFSSNDTLITDLYAGVYFLSVVDSASCTYSEEFILTEPTDSLLANESIINNTCFGDSIATILITPIGGIPNYSIEWQGPNAYNSSNLFIDSLQNGLYTYTLNDSNMCSRIDSILITSQAEILANEIVQHINCFANDNGSIELNPSGGGTTYSYSWTGPNGFISAFQIITDLVPGDYCVDIVSDLLCSRNFCFSILETDSLWVIDSLINPTCGYSNGSIFIEINGGNSPYSVDWGGETGQNITAIPAGIYVASIIDSLNCAYSFSYELFGPDSLIVQDSILQITCNGENDGSILIEISGGTPLYDILWIGPNGYTSENLLIENLVEGNYQLSLVDSLSCSTFNEYYILMPDSISIEVFIEVYDNGFNVSEYGFDDGLINIISTDGGTPEYEYNWNGPNGFFSDQTLLGNLAAGQYDLLILDANSCAYIDSIILSAPNSIDIPTGFTPNNDGFNDLFILPGISSNNPASIQVFNRWGNLVYERSNYENNWDGYSKNGKELPDGTYFVIVDFINDGKKINGYVDLRR